MGKKDGTSRRGRGRPRKDEQLPLIDVGPENLKKILPLVRQYNQIMHEKVRLLDQEVKLKQKILDLIKKEELSRLADGSIRFTCDGTTIEIIPRDEVVRIKKNKVAQHDKDEAGSIDEMEAYERDGERLKAEVAEDLKK